MTFEEIEEKYEHTFNQNIKDTSVDIIAFEKFTLKYFNGNSILHFQASLMLRARLIKMKHGL